MWQYGHGGVSIMWWDSGAYLSVLSVNSETRVAALSMWLGKYYVVSGMCSGQHKVLPKMLQRQRSGCVHRPNTLVLVAISSCTVEWEKWRVLASYLGLVFKMRQAMYWVGGGSGRTLSGILLLMALVGADTSTKIVTPDLKSTTARRVASAS